MTFHITLLGLSILLLILLISYSFQENFRVNDNNIGYNYKNNAFNNPQQPQNTHSNPNQTNNRFTGF